MVLLWLSLAVAIGLAAGGTAFAVARGIGLYRRAKQTGRAFSARVERIAHTMSLVERHLAAAQASAGRFGTAAAQLRASQSQLGVQLAAIREARGQLRRLLWFVPGI